MELLITTILSNIAAVGILGFLLKLWIDKRLSHTLDLELEKFKSKLAKDVARDSIQQQWINNKRVELFAKLHEVMLEMDLELKALFINIKVKCQGSTKDRAIKFCEKYLELNAVLTKNELFIEHELIEKIRMLYRPFYDLGIGFFNGNTGLDELSDALPDSIEDLAKMAEQPRNLIIETFRGAIGLGA